MATTSRPGPTIGGGLGPASPIAWVVIVAVLLVLLAAMVLYVM